MSDPKPEKPYKFDSIPKPITQTDLTQWQLTMWDYLKSIGRYKRFIKKDLTWGAENVINRGFTSDVEGTTKLTAEEKADIIDSILLKIGTYGPKAIFIDITKRSNSFKFIWNSIRKVCGFPVPGAKLIQYMTLKHSFDPSTTSYNEQYWAMRDMKIECLLSKDSSITFNGSKVEKDEEITPSLENQVVVDWLESIGGIKLIKFVGQEYAKELEKISLFDLQEVLGQQETMQAIIDRMENEEEIKLGRAEVKASRNSFQKQGTREKYKNSQRRICYFCKELGNKNYNTHDTKFCRLRQSNKEKEKSAVKSFKSLMENNSSSQDSTDTEDEDEIKIRKLLAKMKHDSD